MSRDPRIVYLEETYLPSLLFFLGFNKWKIRIDTSGIEDGDWAQIHVEDYNEATICLGQKWWRADPITKVEVLIHELCHAPVVRIHEPLKEGIASVLKWLPKNDKPKAQEQLDIHLKSAVRREEELVNHLAILLAPLAPKLELD